MSHAQKPSWTNISHEPFLLHVPEGITNPVLTAGDVTDVAATGVADPFLFCENDTWYMFFEVISSSGCHIGLATSSNGLRWTYDQIVLYKDDLDTHQAFPLVLQYDGSYYMIPDPGGQSQVWIYEASDFPYNWSRVNAIVSGRRFVDPSIFMYNDTWWMFLGARRDCYLYYSGNLKSGWVEHPMSPIVSNDRSKARPGGRSFAFDNDRIIRIAQKCDVTYGEQVRAFEVDILTREDYSEHEVPQSPLLERTGSGWNSGAMHQYEPWWNGNHWLVAADGNGVDGWSIGMYVTEYITEGS